MSIPQTLNVKIPFSPRCFHALRARAESNELLGVGDLIDARTNHHLLRMVWIDRLIDLLID